MRTARWSIGLVVVMVVMLVGAVTILAQAKGDTGVKGATGVGTAGVKGSTGLQGPKGNPGTGGVKGSTGLAGATGQPGGPTGFTGPIGLQGYSGTPGQQGFTGPQGQTGTGVQGFTGSGTPGQQGFTGMAGSPGFGGITGPTGPTGATGPGGVEVDTLRWKVDKNWHDAINDTLLVRQGAQNWSIGNPGIFWTGTNTLTSTCWGYSSYIGTFGQSYNYMTIAGGYSNSVLTSYATVGGGMGNSINGQYGVIAGGNNNKIQTYAASAILGGQTNVVSGAYTSVVGGLDNRDSAQYSVILGGEQNKAYPSGVADYSVLSGYKAVGSQYGGVVHGGRGVLMGQAQVGTYVLSGATTTSDTATIYLDGFGGSKELVVGYDPTNYYSTYTWAIRMVVVAEETQNNPTGMDSVQADSVGMWVFEGVVRRTRIAGHDSIWIVDTLKHFEVLNDTTWKVVPRCVLSMPSGVFRVRVYSGSTTVRWVAKIETVETYRTAWK